ncbi:alpha/beta hydrolase [Pectobacteriaceae bacterium CE70]|nr:alpha/beta hydrolase [Pectobacteriaceae bacterium C52]WJV68285.1 alpha/beta hydrolase [Pectobacteriaceae bacterium CE70]WJY12215.1 alpha/beta hydrolase [Pectobacteriaceae bacterium C80]
MNDKKHVYVIHGYTATPTSHWFGWLTDQLHSLGTDVSILAMPNSTDPDNAAWQKHIAENVKTLDEQTFFVGHSLGCVTLLRYLQSKPASVKVGGAVLAAGFLSSLPILPSLDEFTAQPLNMTQLKTQILRRAVILSLNDDIVPPELSLALSQQLDADLYGVPNSGHFLERDGYTRFDKLFAVLKDILV